MECVHENVGTNLIKAYMSWNVPNQKNNKRLIVSMAYMLRCFENNVFCNHFSRTKTDLRY